MVPSQEGSLLILFYKIIGYTVLLFHKGPVNLHQHELATVTILSGGGPEIGSGGHPQNYYGEKTLAKVSDG